MFHYNFLFFELLVSQDFLDYCVVTHIGRNCLFFYFFFSMEQCIFLFFMTQSEINLPVLIFYNILIFSMCCKKISNIFFKNLPKLKGQKINTNINDDKNYIIIAHFFLFSLLYLKLFSLSFNIFHYNNYVFLN